jgi:hypothetical protein
MTGADLWGEFNAARLAMTPPDRALLEGHGITPGNILFLIGVAQARVSGGLYEPAEDGGAAYITPALVYDAISPESPCPAQTVRFGELCDLVAWHPRRPLSWALRVGSAEWLGSSLPQYFDPPPVPIRRGVLSWLQGGAVGLVPLSRSRTDRYRLLSGCQNGVVAEDAKHRAELSQILATPWPAPPVTIAEQEGCRRAA